MRIFALIALIACAVAAPTGEQQLEKVKPEPVPILKQINQLNDDGSYTFGFESGDGSFRVETRDINGHIRGKYGYVDENGAKQVLEYVSGKDAGKALGFQPSGVLAPYPILRAQQSPEQLVLDYQYSSVDLNEDGIPDAAPLLKAAHHETETAHSHAKAANPAAKIELAAPEPVVVAVEVAPAPAAEPVQQDTATQVIQAPLPVPFVRAPVPVQFAPAPLQFAPAAVQFAPGAVQFAQPFPQQIFRLNAEQQTSQQRQSAVVDQQFLEDLQNQSVDANEDGQPDQAVQIVQGPSVRFVQSPFSLFGSRIV